MRATILLGCALIAAGCSTKETTPAADTAAPVAETSAAPAAMSLADVAGTWNFRVMGMDSDSTLTTHVLTATEDTTGWSFAQPNGETVAVRNVVAAGDSLTTAAGPFSSGVMRGRRVREIRSVYRMQDGKLVGIVTARYETGADSVRQFRLEGTKQ